MESLGHRLVIGPGGSGTSHRVSTWIEEFEVGGDDVLTVRGDSSVPVAPGVIDRVRSAADTGISLVIVHDAHWLPDDLVVELVHAADRVLVWASRRPWPVSDVLRSFDDRLTLERPADRTGPATLDELAPVIARRSGRAASNDLVETVHAMSSGWFGIAMDAVDALGAGWQPVHAMPVDLRDRLVRRVERAGPHAVALVRLLAVAPDVDPALADRLVLEQRPGPTGMPLRSASAGGLLVDSGTLVPLIGSAVRDDMTTAEVAEVHESLSRALAGVDRDRSIDHAVAGSARGSAAADDLLEAARRDLARDPVRAAALVERARSAGAEEAALAVLETELHLGAGRVEALATLDRARSASPALTSELRRLDLAVDLRAGRWDRVAAGDDHGVDDQAVADAVRLARVMTGILPDDGAGTETDPGGTARRPGPLGMLADALVDVLAGRRPEALRALAEVADDEITGESGTAHGLSPSLVATSAALLLGELAAAEAFVDRALASGATVGEERSAVALRRYVGLRRSRATEAAEATRTQATSPDEGSGWARDELLEAALTTAMARRTGDLVRLRSAWEAADPVLLRVHPAWVLLDPLTELLVTGTRLGRRDRTAPAIEQLWAQVEQASTSDGPVAAAFAWTQLHLALVAAAGAGGANDAIPNADENADENADIDAAVERLQRCAAASAHAGARAVAAVAWREVAAGRVDEAAVVAAVDGLVAVDEGWEAARLAGQAALDATDAAVTRRLLERARSAAAEVIAGEHAETDGLVGLGLSEREAEVARLVADGRTHKEIGAQLYVSPKTVEHHVARIRQKLGAASRAELLAIVRKHH